MRNTVLRYTYSIDSSADDEVRFPALCAVNLFDQMQMKNGIVVKYPIGVATLGKSNQIINCFLQREDVEIHCNKKYGGMFFKFMNRIDTNVDLLPLLQMDSISIQYILLSNLGNINFKTMDWNISETKLIRHNLAKFICSMNQDRDLEFYFSAQSYDVQELKLELKSWEKKICEITGMLQMKIKDRSILRTSRFIEITLS